MVNSNRLTIMLNFDTYRIPVSYNIIEAVCVSIFSPFKPFNISAEIISGLHVIGTTKGDTAPLSTVEHTAITLTHFLTLPANALFVLLG